MVNDVPYNKDKSTMLKNIFVLVSAIFVATMSAASPVNFSFSSQTIQKDSQCVEPQQSGIIFYPLNYLSYDAQQNMLFIVDKQAASRVSIPVAKDGSGQLHTNIPVDGGKVSIDIHVNLLSSGRYVVSASSNVVTKELTQKCSNQAIFLRNIV